MDVAFNGVGNETSQLNAQAAIYSGAIKACLQVPSVCKSFETWGFTDKYTWLVNKFILAKMPYIYVSFRDLTNNRFRLILITMYESTFH